MLLVPACPIDFLGNVMTIWAGAVLAVVAVLVVAVVAVLVAVFAAGRPGGGPFLVASLAITSRGGSGAPLSGRPFCGEAGTLPFLPCTLVDP